MTVSTTTIKNSYSGNGTLHSFAYGFKIFADGDLTVIIRNAAGVETVRTLNTHYIVTNANNDSGGNVLFKFNTGTSSDAHFSNTDFRPATGETVVIKRSLALTQGTDYVANDPFAAEDHETALDRLTFITQEIQEELDRSIKLSKTNTMTSTEFTTSSTARANKILAFDSSGELAVTQELGTFKGNSATTTTAAFLVRDIVKATTTAQLNNIYICVANAAIGDALTDTDHFAVLVDAVAAAASATTATTKATAAATSETNAAATLVTFQRQYHGAASSDPSSNLDAGDLYFNTSTGMKVYTGSAWSDVKPTSSEQTNINTVAGSDSEIAVLAASAVVADMAILATNAIVADMAILATDAIVADMAILATDAIVADMAILGTDAIVADMAILGTSAVVADMAILATSAIVADMAILGTNDVVTDMNVLGTADVVTDMNVLGTSANVTAMGLLGTSAVVEDMGLLGTSAVVADMASLAGSGANPNITSVTTSGDLVVGGLLKMADVTSGKILVGDGTSYQEVAVSGDVTIGSNGAVAIAALNFSKMENLTVSRALVSDGSGDVSVSAVTSTEIGYLDGVTSAIQTQIDDRASKGFSTAMSIAL